MHTDFEYRLNTDFESPYTDFFGGVKGWGRCTITVGGGGGRGGVLLLFLFLLLLLLMCLLLLFMAELLMSYCYT